jgi:uncharacterized protein
LLSIYSPLEINRLIENRLIMGMYPEVVTNPDESKDLIKELAGSYLYKDVLTYRGLRSPEALERLLQAMALQVGSEVSFNELAGIRNAVIRNFNPIHLRQDTGHLWENFLISERMKYNLNNRIDVNVYFWRSHQQQIDYLEDNGGLLSGFEMKWGTKKHRIPKIFLSTYKGSTIGKIDRTNFIQFLSVCVRGQIESEAGVDC